MNRLKQLCFVLGAILLVSGSGCGRRVSQDQSPLLPPSQKALQATRVKPSYVHFQPVSDSLRDALQAESSPADNLARLPQRLRDPGSLDKLLGPIPQPHRKLASTGVEVKTYVLGKDSFLAADNTVASGNSRTLNAPLPGVSWAVYELSGFKPGDSLSDLYIEDSQQNFSGRLPGIWISFANYDTGRWEMINRTAQANYRRVLNKTVPYLSASGTFYVALILADGQSVSVDRVGFGVTNIWSRLVLEKGPDSGWTPAVVMDQYSSIHVAFANHSNGDPQYAYCLGTSDPLDIGAWIFNPIDTQSAGQANWMDIVMDPVNGHPSVSYVYSGLSAPEGNSQVVLANLIDHPTKGLIWANYGFPADGAEYTSIDYHEPDGAFGFACAVRNDNSPSKKPYDIEYRYWDLGSPWDPSDDGPVSKLSGFGEDLFFPHLRYRPGTGEATMQADGAVVLAEGDPDVWLPIFQKNTSGTFGSLAWMPAGVSGPTVMGSTYSEVKASKDHLYYVAFDASQLGIPEEIDSIGTAGGSWIGGASQLAYLRNGEPVIAYTVYDGSEVQLKYAHKLAGAWKLETVVAQVGDSADPQTVLADIAAEPANLFFEPTGRVAIVYNVNLGGKNSLEIAVKTEDLGP